MRIAVVGTGYVGLVAGTCFAETGHSVTCVDVDEAKLAALRAGKTPIYEPGLEELLLRNSKAERLFFTNDLRAAVRGAEVVFIAVGTPQRDDGNADLRTVMRVAHDIADAAERYTVVVNKAPSRWGPRKGCKRSSPPAARCRSTWSRIRSSSRKAPPSTTSCGPTGS
jgi:UDPglucose 6-dehydrogenase